MRCYLFTIVCREREPLSTDTGIEKNSEKKREREKKKCYPMVNSSVEPQLLDQTTAHLY